jgi:hypothetical protein
LVVGVFCHHKFDRRFFTRRKRRNVTGVIYA